MLTESEIDGPTWRLRLQPESDDPGESTRGQGGRSVSLRSHHARVDLPLEPASSPHPDAEALAVLVVTRPWIGTRLIVSRPVSRQFADLAHRVFKVHLAPIDPTLEPRRAGSTPVLAYSAGYDSTAASALFPEVPHVHHRRVSHPDLPDPGTYRADAIELLTQRAAHRGRDVHVVRADFEHLTGPYPSLPHWFGFAVGPLLLAYHFDAGAIVLGGTLETCYMDMGRRWTGQPKPGTGIAPLPELVGVPIMRPFTGVTEVGTMRLAADSDLSDATRSCVRGTLHSACGRCAKCIRKDLLTTAVTGRPSQALMSLTADAPGWDRIVNGPRPIYMQAQLEYALARIDDLPAPLRDLRDELRPDAAETGWMASAYPPAVGFSVPRPWQEETARLLETELGWMTEGDVHAMRRWDRAVAA